MLPDIEGTTGLSVTSSSSRDGDISVELMDRMLHLLVCLLIGGLIGGLVGRLVG